MSDCPNCERLTRERNEVHEDRNTQLDAKYALIIERDRLRAALESIVASKPHPRWHHEMQNIAQQALSGDPPAKRAYYETHEPPHCPSCSCGSALIITDRMQGVDCPHCEDNEPHRHASETKAIQTCPTCGADWHWPTTSPPKTTARRCPCGKCGYCDCDGCSTGTGCDYAKHHPGPSPSKASGEPNV